MGISYGSAPLCSARSPAPSRCARSPTSSSSRAPWTDRARGSGGARRGSSSGRTGRAAAPPRRPPRPRSSAMSPRARGTDPSAPPRAACVLRPTQPKSAQNKFVPRPALAGQPAPKAPPNEHARGRQALGSCGLDLRAAFSSISCRVSCRPRCRSSNAFFIAARSAVARLYIAHAPSREPSPSPQPLRRSETPRLHGPLSELKSRFGAQGQAPSS